MKPHVISHMMESVDGRIDCAMTEQIEPSNMHDGKPLLVVTSEDCPREYHETLTRQGISWIAVGKGCIDLKEMLEILNREFNVDRMAVVGCGHINGSFLAEGLLDEISVMIGPGIDGRKGMASVFDGIDDPNRPATLLKLNSLERMGDTVWLRYTLKSE